MTTQFLLSLLGVGIAGGSFALLVGFATYKWYKKEPIALMTPIVTTYLSIIAVLGAVSGYHLLTSSYHLAKKGTEMVIEKGQDLVSSAISFGTVTILEGFGKTYDHFQNKWEKESIAKAEKLSFSIISMKKIEKETDAGVHIVFSVKNSGSKNIHLEEMIKHELILLKDEKGLCYPLKIANSEPIDVHPNTTLVSEVDVVLPKGIVASKLVTPTQSLSLGR